jgi:hypothetical protein
MVEFFHDLVNILVGYVLKTAAFGKVLPDQAIGVFVQAALPRAVRMGEVNVRSQRRLDSFVSGKLFAVVCGDGSRPCPNKALAALWWLLSRCRRVCWPLS